MQKLSFLFVCSILVLVFACSDSKHDDKKAGAPAKKQATVANSSPYPSVSQEIMASLWENCTAIDFLFYELPVSMSQDDQASIRQTLTHVSTNIPAYDKSCKAIGRVFFQADGEPLTEAEIFFSQKCQYYVFHEKGKPAYANAMTEAGVQFMNKVLAVKTAPAGGQ